MLRFSSNMRFSRPKMENNAKTKESRGTGSTDKNYPFNREQLTTILTTGHWFGAISTIEQDVSAWVLLNPNQPQERDHKI